MNEQIKQLAQQCWDKRLDGLHFDQEKFAELIVRECAKVGDFECPRCGHCCPQRLVQELPPPLTKGQAWQKWWYETRGKHMVAGGAHPMEWAMYDAFNSGWDAAKQNSEKD